MYAVIFEFETKPGCFDDYYATAVALRPDVDKVDGFLGIHRYASRMKADRFISLSTWRDEAAIAQWREFDPHRQAQNRGRNELFADYRLRVGPENASEGTILVAEGRGLTGDGELFDSVSEPGKMLSLGGSEVGGEVERSFKVKVMRDYGMVSRAEAPRRSS
jgi:heme-degrading monooxygenase HmoA